MKHLVRLLREPLVHFLAIGGLIFLLFGAVAEPIAEPPDTIVVWPERIEQLTAGFQAVWRRPPTETELSTLIDDFVREEVYYREALAIGLDRDDTIIRRRLRQKMEFLTDTGADILQPTTGDLDAYLAANEQTYRHEPRLAFEQVYLGEAPSPETVTSFLKTLRSDLATDPSVLGERSLLPAQLGLSRPGAIDGTFGKGFFERIAEIQPGEWAGPVKSGYGVHLVHILDSQPARTPPLEEVRDAVLRDWRNAKALELRELNFGRLRQRYVVEIRRADTKTAEAQ